MFQSISLSSVDERLSEGEIYITLFEDGDERSIFLFDTFYFRCIQKIHMNYMLKNLNVRNITLY